MATRCRIGFKTPKGIKHVYSHWDGYPDHVGKILFLHYNNKDKIKALLSLGNISSLAPEIGEKQDFDNADYKNFTVFYGRDRGDNGEGAKIAKNEAQFLDTAIKSWAEYVYLYKDNQWFYKTADDAGDFTPLEDYFLKKPLTSVRDTNILLS